MYTPKELGRWDQLEHLAKAVGLDHLCATHVKRYVGQHEEARAVILGATDQQLTTVFEQLATKYPRARRADFLVDFLVQRLPSPLPNIGCSNCDDGTIWFERPADLYGGRLETFAAYCERCNSQRLRTARSERARAERQRREK